MRRNLKPGNLQCQKNGYSGYRSFKNNQTCKASLHVYHEFGLSQVRGNFDRLDSAALITGHHRPAQFWE
jgi:hypothetical protein